MGVSRDDVRDSEGDLGPANEPQTPGDCWSYGRWAIGCGIGPEWNKIVGSLRGVVVVVDVDMLGLVLVVLAMAEVDGRRGLVDVARGSSILRAPRSTKSEAIGLRERPGRPAATWCVCCGGVWKAASSAIGVMTSGVA